MHKGIEIEFGWKPFTFLQWDQVVSIGDWKWNSGDTARVYNSSGQLIKKFYFDAKGVHVGGAAQIQWMEGLRWEIIKSLYLSGSLTYFGKNYSEMDPSSLEKEPRDSWKMPDYFLVDLNAGYRFTFKKFKLDVRGSVLNLLDRGYISDATNNDSYSTNTQGFDAASAGVFFGVGRTFNVSLALSY
jgi:outer membrane receptor protein involved in Fe transport